MWGSSCSGIRKEDLQKLIAADQAAYMTYSSNVPALNRIASVFQKKAPWGMC